MWVEGEDKVYMFDNPYIDHGKRKNKYKNIKGSCESDQGFEAYAIRDIRGDIVEINQEVQRIEKTICEICKKYFTDDHALKTHIGMKHNDKYNKKDWLYENYINQKRSAFEIAKECKCHPSTIYRSLKHFNIPIRTYLEANINKFEKGYVISNKGKPMSEETKKKLSEIKKGKYIGINNPFYGKHHTEETKKILSDKQKGNQNAKGSIRSEELKRKMSEMKKGQNAGEKSPNWKGGKYQEKRGYKQVKKPKHSNSDVRGYKFEHRLIMEQCLGRRLWNWEIIHHINENKSDNRIENLFLCENNKHHSTIHKQLERMAIELFKNEKYSKIKIDKEEGIYYIIYKEE